MPSPEARLEAETLVDSYAEASPLVRLAELSAPACRVEPQLLRRLRLACVPEADVSVEQELWFSELVDSRGSTITFRDSVSHVLRWRLRALRDLRPDLVERAHRLMTDLHADLSPLLILEDQLAWAEVLEDDETIRSGAQTLLRSLLAGRAGLDNWLGRAWPGLPSDLKRLPEGRQLAQVAALHGASIDEEALPSELGAVAHVLPVVALLLKREEARLELNVRPAEATHLIEVPDTRPRGLRVMSRGGSQEIVFGPREARGVDVGRGGVTLRTLSGAEYELEALAGAANLFEIEMLPAEHGTSLLISYGGESTPSRVLVDCGPARTGRVLAERLRQLEPSARKLDLLVLTHVDDDRIGGAFPLLEDTELQLRFGEIWFNGYSQFRFRESVP